MTDIEQMLLNEMQSEDHIDQMISDDVDGKLIDAVMDGHTDSIFSDPYEESEDDDDGI